MGVVLKMLRQTEIKSHGDVFHDIMKHRPHHVSAMSPDKVQSCDLHEGEWGTEGSIIFWNYFHDGKAKVGKNIVGPIDEVKRSITFTVIEGDLLELYKTFVVVYHVDTVGDNHLVSWTFEYEKLNEDVPDPVSLMDFLIDLAKDMGAHDHSKAI